MTIRPGYRVFRRCRHPGADQPRHTMQCQHVTLGSAAGDDPGRHVRNERVMPEFLALMDVGDVDFQYRHLTHLQRIQDRHRRVAERRRIDNDAAGDFPRLMDPVDQFVFAVALVATQFQTQSGGRLAARSLDVRERFVTVNFRLPLAQQIEVRAVQVQTPNDFSMREAIGYFCRQGNPAAFQPDVTPRCPARSGGPSNPSAML